MLEQANRRTFENGWKNVSLVHNDALTYQFPDPGLVLNNAVKSLMPEGRLALLDLQLPSYWPSWLATLAVRLMKPFAVTDEWVSRRPWESIQGSMTNLLSDITMTERYFGMTYIISGKKALHVATDMRNGVIDENFRNS
jgi:hypothetical protein